MEGLSKPRVSTGDLCAIVVGECRKCTCGDLFASIVSLAQWTTRSATANEIEDGFT